MISGVKKIFKDIFEYFFYSWYHYINPSRGIRVDIMSNTQAISFVDPYEHSGAELGIFGLGGQVTILIYLSR